MYGEIQCEECGHETFGKVVPEVRPAGREACPRCGATAFAPRE